MARNNSNYINIIPCYRKQCGVALITAIFLVAIVVTITSLMALNQQVWIRQVQNMADKSQATSVLQGAYLSAAALLAADAKLNDSDHLKELWATLPLGGEAEGGLYIGTASDAQSLFNLNNLVTGDKPSAPDIAVFRKLLSHVKLDENLVEAVIDWIDKDEKRRPNGGAEDTTYLGKQPVAYRTPNKLMESVQELRLIEGFSAPQNRQGLNRLFEFVTVLPKRTAINVNTAPAVLINAILPGGNGTIGENIVKYRAKTPFESKKDFLGQLIKGQKAPQVEFDVKTSYFFIRVQTEFGRLSNRSIGLLYRPSKGKKTKLLWRSREPIIIDLNKENKDEKSTA